MSNKKPLEIMVFVSNPEGFEAWPSEKQLERHRCIMKWHDHISKINPVTIPYVWGTHQILSQVRLSPVQDMYILVYRVQSLAEFDELMIEDPLRDCSHYKTVLLTDLAKDLEDDKKRFEDALKDLTHGRDKKVISEIERQRSRFKLAPDYVGKYKSITPNNPVVNYFKDPSEPPSERPLEILIHGMNPPEYMAWDDARKLVHYEKVLWWHDHIAQMLDEGRVSHVWGTHDFCDISIMSYRSASGVTIYRAKDLDEFDEIYRLDPLRDHGRFWSTVLKPIDEQRILDEKRLVLATKRAAI